MKQRAVIYARVSSAAQREAHTIESQLRVLPEFVERMGWELAAPPTTYVDDGRTAKAGHLEKRTAFARLLKDAAARRFDIVAVVDFDRLTRSEDHAERGAILGAIQRAGVRVAVASSGQVLDLSSSTGDLFATLQAVFAAEENRKRRERSIRGREQAIRRGKNPAGPPPFGLRYDDANGWRIEEGEADLVREVYRRVAAGESCPAVGRDLELRGARSPRGGRWAYSVWNLITKPTYRGVYEAGGPGGSSIAVPALVDDELWHAAQDALLKHGRRGLDRTKHEYLVAKIARCAACGGEVWTQPGWRKNGKSKVSYYVCSRRRYPRHGEERCETPWHAVEDVDARVWRVVVDLVTRPDTIERALAKRGDLSQEGQAWAADLADYQTRLERLDAAQAAILQRFSRGLIPEAVMDAQLVASAREREFLQAQVAAARARTAGLDQAKASLEQVVAQLGAVATRLEGAPMETRRRFLAALCSSVQLAADGAVLLEVALPDVSNGARSSEEKLGPLHRSHAVRFRLVA